eukprot:s827_g15.t1
MKLWWLIPALALMAVEGLWGVLQAAAADGRSEEVQRLRHGDVDCGSGPNDDTALAASGGLETAELLLQHGASVDVKHKYGDTPLRSAAYNGHLQVVKLLAKHGGSIQAFTGLKGFPTDVI